MKEAAAPRGRAPMKGAATGRRSLSPGTVTRTQTPPVRDYITDL